ncbi:MAG: oxidoreductase, partial [Actinobacteria bacterium]|nr:oxidoreductase [Actinomycetota bacterium]
MTADPTVRFSLVGKSIVITGASGSMGREAALGLGAAGANITLAGGNQAALEELAARPELAGAAIAPF